MSQGNQWCNHSLSQWSSISAYAGHRPPIQGNGDVTGPALPLDGPGTQQPQLYSQNWPRITTKIKRSRRIIRFTETTQGVMSAALHRLQNLGLTQHNTLHFVDNIHFHCDFKTSMRPISRLRRRLSHDVSGPALPLRRHTGLHSTRAKLHSELWLSSHRQLHTPTTT